MDTVVKPRYDILII
ncbi:hypothetical protein ACFLK3_07120 [Rickettsia sibirica]